MLANIASQRRLIRQPSFDEYPKVDHAKRTSVQWHGELDNAKKKRLQWAISRSESTPNIFARRVRKVIRCRKDANDDLFINLNISGVRFQLLKSLVRRYPDSLLAKVALASDAKNAVTALGLIDQLADSDIIYLPETNEYFAQRSPLAFELILNYCNTENLHCPPAMCHWMLLDELAYWGLGQPSPSLCCADEPEEINESNAANSVSEDVEDEPNDKNDPVFPRNRWGSFQQQLWIICEKPKRSKAALAFAIISIAFVLLAVIIEIIRTVPQLRECPHNLTGTNMSSRVPAADSFNSILLLLKAPKIPMNLTEDTEDNSTSNVTTGQSNEQSSKGGSIAEYSTMISTCDMGILVLDAIEIACIFWFTLELIIRFVAADKKTLCLTSPLNILDFLATAPWYIQWIATTASIDLRSNNYIALYTTLTFMRIIRILTILKLGRYVKAMRMFGKTLIHSSTELGLLLLFVIVNLVVFSSIIYHLEHQEKDTMFVSIPASFWWCIATLTTTGYGDEVPRTALGRFICGIACVVGILTMAFPVSILVESFNDVYKTKTSRKRARKYSILARKISMVMMDKSGPKVVSGAIANESPATLRF